MIEPANLTALIDRFGDTWIRVDEVPGQNGSWWPLTDGPCWDTWGRNKVGVARSWEDLQEYGPFVEAAPERSAGALAAVREAAAS